MITRHLSKDWHALLSFIYFLLVIVYFSLQSLRNTIIIMNSIFPPLTDERNSKTFSEFSPVAHLLCETQRKIKVLIVNPSLDLHLPTYCTGRRHTFQKKKSIFVVLEI